MAGAGAGASNRSRAPSSCRTALRLLFRLGDRSITLRFLHDVTTAIYSGGLNAELATVHLIVDARVAGAFAVTPACYGEQPVAQLLLDQLQERHPGLLEHQRLSADKV